MRSAFDIAALLSCVVTISASAQVQWDFYHSNPQQLFSVIGSGSESLDGSLNFMFASDEDPLGEHRLLRYSADGLLLSNSVDTLGFWSVPTRVPSGGIARALVRQLPDSSVDAWVSHYYTDAGSLLRSDTIPFSPHWSSKAVMSVGADGEVHIFHALKTAPDLPYGDRLLCMRINLNDGTYVTRLLTGDHFWPQEIHAYPDGYRVFFAAGSFFSQSASLVGQVVSFNRDFDFVGGYAIPPLTGLPGMAIGDSVPMLSYYGYMHDDGSAIVVGKLTTPSAAANKYAVRTTATGEIEEMLPLPLGNLAHEAELGPLTRAPDGTLIWAVPIQAAGEVTRVYIFRFNEELDLLSQSLALNGFFTGRYYQPNVLLATQDGNCVIAGDYRDEFTNPYGNAFVVKFAMPVGLEETELATSAFSVFPSPATDEINVQWPSHGSTGRWRIHDAIGQLVAEGRCTSRNISINVSTFVPGFYTIWLEKPDGSSLGARSWLKE